MAVASMMLQRGRSVGEDAMLFKASLRSSQASWHGEWWSDAAGNVMEAGSAVAEVVDEDEDDSASAGR
jgi:hypothetical protein